MFYAQCSELHGIKLHWMNKLWCDRHHIPVIYSCNLQDFPLGGGIDPWGGSADLRRGCFSVETCAKMKELGSVGHAIYIVS